MMGPLGLSVAVERWPLRRPFRISGHLFQLIDVLVVSLEKDGCKGRGEASGVYYKNDQPSTMIAQIESVRTLIEAGITRDSLQTLLPAGGARNAVDCALWDLEAGLSGRPVWQLAGLPQPRPLVTTFTCGADIPEVMAVTAREYTGARAIKLKLTGEPIDADRVRAVREARRDVWLGVDANQGFSLESLLRLIPTLVDAGVALIEQPFPVSQTELLDAVEIPIPVAADESAQTLADLSNLVGRFDIVNIKLDKCGGLTEGVAMARAARALGLKTMVGNMFGTSLAMGPAFIVGQLCEIVDLDGPIFLQADRPARARYEDGFIACPEPLWGYPTPALSK
jgi:L-alanine-DL-glutamate epimerase-like enolase superfamily enzyme